LIATPYTQSLTFLTIRSDTRLPLISRTFVVQPAIPCDKSVHTMITLVQVFKNAARPPQLSACRTSPLPTCFAAVKLRNTQVLPMLHWHKYSVLPILHGWAPMIWWNKSIEERMYKACQSRPCPPGSIDLESLLWQPQKRNICWDSSTRRDNLEQALRSQIQ